LHVEVLSTGNNNAGEWMQAQSAKKRAKFKIIAMLYRARQKIPNFAALQLS